MSGRSPTREIKFYNSYSFFSHSNMDENAQEIFSDITKEIKQLSYLSEKYKKLSEEASDAHDSRLDFGYSNQALQLFTRKIDECDAATWELRKLSKNLQNILKFTQTHHIPENEAYPFILKEIKNFQEITLPAIRIFRDGHLPKLQETNFWGMLVKSKLQPEDVLNNLKSLAAQGSVIETSDCIIKEKFKPFSGTGYTLENVASTTQLPLTPSTK